MFQKKNSLNLNLITNMKFKNAWTAIAAFFTFDTAVENVMTEEHVEKLNTELTRLNSENTLRVEELVAANASIATLTTEKATAVSELATANATIAEQVTAIAALKQNPGQPAAAVITKTEIGNAENKEELLDFVTKTDNTADCIAKMKEMGYK